MTSNDTVSNGPCVMTIASAEDPDPVVNAEIEDSVACLECAVKHATAARIEYSEYLQNRESVNDLMYCIGDLACAERHVLSYNKDISELLRQVRKSVLGGGVALGQFDDAVLMLCTFAKLFDDRRDADEK